MLASVILLTLTAGCIGPRVVRIPTAAMEPTLKLGSMVVIMRALPCTISVDYGDLIVFRGSGEDEDKLYLKRAVALEGDTVQVRRATLYRNGELVKEPYITASAPESHEWRVSAQVVYAPEIENYGPATVPEGHIFVMGDNRLNSRDSRSYGPIPKGAVVGWLLWK